MKNTSVVMMLAMLAISVSACGESEEQKRQKAANAFLQPYTEKIPVAEKMKPGERYFDVKPGAHSQEKKQ